MPQNDTVDLFEKILKDHPNEVIMFVKPSCPRCITWKASLLEKGIKVYILDISTEEYEEYFDELLECLKTYNNSFPYCFYNGFYYASEEMLQKRLSTELVFDMDF